MQSERCVRGHERMEGKVSKRQGGEEGWAKLREDLTLQCFAGLFQTNPLTEDFKKKKTEQNRFGVAFFLTY